MTTPDTANTAISDGDGVGCRPVLHVFKGPFVTVADERRRIPESCERLVVWLALKRSHVDRGVAAGVLWPVVDDRRAAGNLRSALWRLRGAGFDLIESSGSSLALHADVTVDVHIAADWARRMIAGTVSASDLRVVPWFADSIALLSGWDDDWAILERERLRHRMLHAFEYLSRMLCQAGRCTEGLDAARTVVAADPLRETGQLALIEAHLAANDVAASRRVFEAYRKLHRHAFGVDPSPRINAAMTTGESRNESASSAAVCSPAGDPSAGLNGSRAHHDVR